MTTYFHYLRGYRSSRFSIAPHRKSHIFRSDGGRIYTTSLHTDLIYCRKIPCGLPQKPSATSPGLPEVPCCAEAQGGLSGSFHGSCLGDHVPGPGNHRFLKIMGGSGFIFPFNQPIMGRYRYCKVAMTISRITTMVWCPQWLGNETMFETANESLKGKFLQSEQWVYHGFCHCQLSRESNHLSLCKKRIPSVNLSSIVCNPSQWRYVYMPYKAHVKGYGPRRFSPNLYGNKWCSISIFLAPAKSESFPIVQWSLAGLRSQRSKWCPMMLHWHITPAVNFDTAICRAATCSWISMSKPC